MAAVSSVAPFPLAPQAVFTFVQLAKGPTNSSLPVAQAVIGAETIAIAKVAMHDL